MSTCLYLPPSAVPPRAPRQPSTTNVDDFVPEGEVDTQFFEEGEEEEEESEEERCVCVCERERERD